MFGLDAISAWMVLNFGVQDLFANFLIVLSSPLLIFGFAAIIAEVKFKSNVLTFCYCSELKVRQAPREMHLN